MGTMWLVSLGVGWVACSGPQGQGGDPSGLLIHYRLCSLWAVKDAAAA